MPTRALWPLPAENVEKSKPVPCGGFSPERQGVKQEQRRSVFELCGGLLGCKKTGPPKVSAFSLRGVPPLVRAERKVAK